MFLSFVLLLLLGVAGVDLILSIYSVACIWVFTMDFVCFGFDSRFVDLRKAFSGHATVNLHLVGQAMNIVLTLLAALICFRGL